MPEDGIGLVEGAFWLASMAVQPWLGRRLDSMGRRRFFIFGAFLMTVVSFAYLVAPVNLVTMVPLRALQEFGAGIAPPLAGADVEIPAPQSILQASQGA